MSTKESEVIDGPYDGLRVANLSESRFASSLPASFFSRIDFVEQSTLHHVAIIMDGNRRWSKLHGHSSAEGHRAGVENAISIVRAASHLNFDCLTLFAFSSANWNRSKLEVDHLFELAGQALQRLSRECIRCGVRLQIIGRRERLPARFRASLDHIVEQTKNGARCLRIALDYSSRDAIFQAAKCMRPEDDVDTFDGMVSQGVAPVDLLIRTGKERRLSDFMLWECAFAELYFSDLYWPDFNGPALCKAVEWFHQRTRRFGG